ncbi:hypothetical protein ZWY2020_024615 [Hordeum vulgare]|nr:hypothetical protein ZWY2020_024615 [Hordeum vulgare]
MIRRLLLPLCLFLSSRRPATAARRRRRRRSLEFQLQGGEQPPRVPWPPPSTSRPGTWRWTRRTARSCSTTSSSPRPARRTPFPPLAHRRRPLLGAQQPRLGDRPVQFVPEPYNGTVPRLQLNPYSWTKVANILFVDTPVGAGFSFSRRPQGYDVGEVSTSLQLHELLIKWFTDRPEFLANPLYIGGDSRAGQLVPFIAQKISEGIEAGRSPILNLKGYLVGNPGTGEIIDVNSRVPYAHGLGIISDQLYETILGHCQGEDYTNPTNTLCAQSLGTFNNSYTAYLTYFWANDALTRDARGIKDGTVDEWVRCHDGDLPYALDIGAASSTTGMSPPTVTVRCGDHDAVVPHLGTQAWVRSLGFPIVDDWRRGISTASLPGSSSFTITLQQLDIRDRKGSGAHGASVRAREVLRHVQPLDAGPATLVVYLTTLMGISHHQATAWHAGLGGARDVIARGIWWRRRAADEQAATMGAATPEAALSAAAAAAAFGGGAASRTGDRSRPVEFGHGAGAGGLRRGLSLGVTAVLPCALTPEAATMEHAIGCLVHRRSGNGEAVLVRCGEEASSQRPMAVFLVVVVCALDGRNGGDPYW